MSIRTPPNGQPLSDAGWLDTHFEACRPEYEAMLRAVGLGLGWYVLDAGCGSGGYLPLLTGLAGEGGRVEALDPSPENVAAVEGRIDLWELPCPVSVRAGALPELPYPDGSFDAAWCGNVTQYLGNEELPGALAELRRVVRPGGLVAVKDVDVQMARFYPADPFLMARLSEACLHGRPDARARAHARGSLRGRELRRWLEKAGLEGVWQRTFIIERWAPLRPAERSFFASWLAHLAALTEERGVSRRLPEDDLAAWRELREPDALDHLVDRPDFYACEAQVLAVGRVPEAGA